MTAHRKDFDPKAYNPTFQWAFLSPKHWGTWLAILFLAPLSFLPNKAKYSISAFIARKLIQKPSRTVNNIWINLALCFPEKSESERLKLQEKCLTTAGVFMLNFANLTLRNKFWLQNNCDLNGLEHLKHLQEQNKNAILLVPHSWCIDIPAVLLASLGLPVSAMAKRQKNPLTDWLMHRQRVQYGGRVYERDGGIKPFIKSIKEGYLGYYLPDQDHGREHSIFIDFYSNRKATLPGLGKLAKVSRSEVLPVFASIDSKTGRFTVDIYPPFSPYPMETEAQDATLMNQFIEQAVSKAPEQYMWILKFLNTPEDPNSTYSPYLDPKNFQKGYVRK